MVFVFMVYHQKVTLTFKVLYRYFMQFPFLKFCLYRNL